MQNYRTELNSQTSTKLCHIKQRCNSLTISTKFNVIMQNVSAKWLAVKNFHFKIARWLTTILKVDKLQYLNNNRSLKCIGRPPSWMFKIKFLMGSKRETHVLRHHAKFCGDRSYCCTDITDIAIFQVKCKTFTGWSHLIIWHNFVNNWIKFCKLHRYEHTRGV